MSERLKRCPFCGEEAFILEDDSSGSSRYSVMCITPECAYWGKFDTEQEAIESWNRRYCR